MPIFTNFLTPWPRLIPTLIAATCLATLSAEEPAAKSLEAAPQMLIEPSSVTLPLAKANLTVGPLQCKSESLQGSYEIKVTPFAFKNDHGSLELNISEKIAKSMANGEAAEFVGVAKSARDGKLKPIKGKTVPKTNGQGSVSFTVSTEDGDLLFNSTYRIVSK